VGERVSKGASGASRLPGITRVCLGFYLGRGRDERDGRWVNRVPYYYSAYQHGSVSINSKAPDKAKAALWDFFVYANVESLDVVSQKKGPTYLDPFRRPSWPYPRRRSWSWASWYPTKF
jgi:hypothetical protein